MLIWTGQFIISFQMKDKVTKFICFVISWRKILWLAVSRFSLCCDIFSINQIETSSSFCNVIEFPRLSQYILDNTNLHKELEISQKKPGTHIMVVFIFHLLWILKISTRTETDFPFSPPLVWVAVLDILLLLGPWSSDCGSFLIGCC